MCEAHLFQDKQDIKLFGKHWNHYHSSGASIKILERRGEKGKTFFRGNILKNE